jgi:hypothetical protein
MFRILCLADRPVNTRVVCCCSQASWSESGIGVAHRHVKFILVCFSLFDKLLADCLNVMGVAV